MKISLLLAAALACSGVIAQEKQVWACQGIFDGATGFSWKNGKARQTLIESSETP